MRRDSLMTRGTAPALPGAAHALLLRSCFAFFGLAVNNVLLLIDLAFLTHIDLAPAVRWPPPQRSSRWYTA